MRIRPFVAACTVAAMLAAPAVGSAAPGEMGCDALDPSYCLLPFPNDTFTVDDPSTHTGKRIDIDTLATPRALRGVKPIFTDELNRNDGFSPGSMILTFVPGLDLNQTWGETTDHIADLSWYARSDAPFLIINARTGERHPFWSEKDTHPETDPARALTILRPAVNFDEGTRYLVALRNMRDATAATIPAGDAFAAYLAGTGADAARQATIDRIVDEVDAAETGRGEDFDASELFLAWEFTVASWQNLAGRALAMRDDAFARLGDFDLANLTVEGRSPAYTIDRVEDSSRDDTEAIVHGSVTVPNYLVGHAQTGDIHDPTGLVTDERLAPLHTPYARLFYPPGEDLPAVNPLQPTSQVPFTCRIPSSASAEDPARPILMGHGLLGDRYEVNWNSGHLLTRDYNSMYCGTPWVGMSFGDIPQAVAILLDPSLFPSLADRAQQAYVNFMFLGRLMIHPDGLASHALFQDEGTSKIDPAGLVYDGNSQGAIMGGALAALAPDYTKAVLGVAGMNYSTLLNRSVDFETGEPAYATFMYSSVPDKQEQQIVMALIQMLWDRAETSGFAAHATDDPYPNTPSHQIVLHLAYGDYQVANVSAEVEARTMGARLMAQSMPDDRHWSVDAGWGLDPIAPGDSHDGSALVYWDSGNLVPPNGNVPPAHVGSDPHEHPRRDAESGIQRDTFFRTGVIIDTGPGSYCTSGGDWQGATTGIASCPND